VASTPERTQRLGSLSSRRTARDSQRRVPVAGRAQSEHPHTPYQEKAAARQILGRLCSERMLLSIVEAEAEVSMWTVHATRQKRVS